MLLFDGVSRDCATLPASNSAAFDFFGDEITVGLRHRRFRSANVLLADGHAAALGLAEDPSDTGYGHSSEQVAAVRIEDPAALVAYHRAVADRSLDLLERLSPDDLERVVDESWDPPVTAGVRWLSIVEDCFMHLGQAQYAAGLRPGG